MKKTLKIWHISQSVNNGYDTFSDAVVIAETEEEAKRIHPYDEMFKDVFYDDTKKKFMNRYDKSNEIYVFENEYGTWTNDLDKIKVELIGVAKEGSIRGVVCASFHAG